MSDSKESKTSKAAPSELIAALTRITNSQGAENQASLQESLKRITDLQRQAGQQSNLAKTIGRISKSQAVHKNTVLQSAVKRLAAGQMQNRSYLTSALAKLSAQKDLQTSLGKFEYGQR